MKKHSLLPGIVFLLLSVAGVSALFAEDSPPAENMSVEQEITELKKQINILESKIKPTEDDAKNPIQSAMDGICLSGGISAGSFYASNPGPDASDNEFLLSNFLVELSSTDKSLPVEFVGAFGETSTPSLLDSPENSDKFDIEYASLTLKPITGVNLEAGLLQPNAGFECTYTYNNENIILGALASQQPYNAYGARLGYDVKSFHLSGGYYKKRLDDQEYKINGSSPEDSWEIGLGGAVSDMEYSLFHYRLAGMRNLTGAVVEQTINNVDIAVNIDYWHWDSSLKNDFDRDYAVGCAVYICPRFDKISLPVRLEYIDQGTSNIYIENTAAKKIYTATISPTYNFSEKSYIRVESAYVNADEAFADKNGSSESDRMCLAAEIGYLF